MLINYEKKYFRCLWILTSFFLMIFSFSSCQTGGGALLPVTVSIAVGEMDAAVNGVSFKAINGTTIKSGSSVVLKASLLKKNSNRDSVSISMIIPTQGTLPYSIDVSTDPSSLIKYCMISYLSGNCINYQTKKGIGSGTIYITSLSPNIEGTFSGTLPQAGGTGSVTITGGAFKVLLP